MGFIGMSLSYRVKTVALFFLELGYKENIEITHMKLQKLVYFAHGWCLAIVGEPLIQESVEAWPYGPVIGNLYQWLKQFGSGPIDIKELPINTDLRISLLELKKDLTIVQLINRVWDVYKDFDAIKLSRMAHLPSSPWGTARKKCPPKKINITIDDDLIGAFFSEYAKDTSQ